MAVTVVGSVMEPQLSIFRDNGSAATLLTVTGAAGRKHIVETSTNLVNWQVIYTNTLPSTGVFVLGDPIRPETHAKFYRAAMVP